MPRLTEEQRTEVVRRYLTGAETMAELGSEFGVTKMAISKLVRSRTPGGGTSLHRLLSPAPLGLALPYMPLIRGVAGHLALIVADPEEWNVHRIMERYSVPHATAVSWFCRQALHLRLLGYSHLFVWSDELASPALHDMLVHKTQGARKLDARACAVVEVSQADADAFYRRYHLQGSCHGRVAYGLEFDGGLVACMSFNDALVCRGGAGRHLLQRFATAAAVRGAASRLLAAFRRAYPGPVVSYSDERYAPSGRLYRRLGFRLESSHVPGYRYWRDGRWWPKNAKQRRHLLAEGVEEGTEFEMAHRLGYARCYDMGKLTWILE